MAVRPFWAGDYLPASAANKHFCTVGTTGSGKTITLLLLMQSVLGALASEPDQRALIYDAKRDILSYLYPLVGKGAVKVLHPFDRRSARWDMARDITTPLSAQQTAAIFVPQDKASHNPFFADASRLLLQGIFLALAYRLQTRGETWTLRDVLLIARSRERMRRLFAQCPYSREVAFYVHPDTKEATSILATLNTKLLPFEPVAAVWEHASYTFSLLDWVKENSILVLGNDESARAALDAINQAIFKRATELVLAQNESDKRRTWFFLDEVREAGLLDGLPRMMTKGRTKGVCAALGFQDMEGMRDAFGDKLANEIVGMCNSKAILRLVSPETAQWASDLRGKHLRWERQTSASRSEGHTNDGNSSTSEESESFSLQERPAAYTSEFFDLPFPNPAHGMTAFYITEEGFYPKTYNPFPLLPRRDILIRNFWERPDSEQYLSPWSDEEEYHFFNAVPVVPVVTSDADELSEVVKEQIEAEVKEVEKPVEETSEAQYAQYEIGESDCKAESSEAVSTVAESVKENPTPASPAEEFIPFTNMLSESSALESSLPTSTGPEPKKSNQDTSPASAPVTKDSTAKRRTSTPPQPAFPSDGFHTARRATPKLNTKEEVSEKEVPESDPPAPSSPFAPTTPDSDDFFDTIRRRSPGEDGTTRS